MFVSKSKLDSLFDKKIKNSDDPLLDYPLNDEGDVKRKNNNKTGIFTNLTNMSDNLKMNKLLIASLSVIFILSAVLAYFWISRQGDFRNPIWSESDIQEFIDSKTYDDKIYNPLNGAEISKETFDQIKDRKPIAVMVNNYVAARPASGLSKADVVYEAVAEGGITRIMPIFYSNIPESVGSIRSARYYFAQLASGYHAHYVHWGAAHMPACQKAPVGSPAYCPPVNGKVETLPETDAYDQIVKLGLANLDGGNYSCERDDCTFGRDPKKLGKMPLEHTAFTRLPLVYDFAKTIRPEENWHKNIPATEWIFKDDASLGDRGKIGLDVPITYNYWSTMAGFNVSWKYEPETNLYIRSQGGVTAVDHTTNESLKAKVIVVRFTKETSANDKKNHLLYELIGKGDALIFQDGKVQKGSWVLDSFDDRDIYVDEQGKQIELNRGQVWVQVLPSENTVNYSVTTDNVKESTTEPAKTN